MITNEIRKFSARHTGFPVYKGLLIHYGRTLCIWAVSGARHADTYTRLRFSGDLGLRFHVLGVQSFENGVKTQITQNGMLCVVIAEVSDTRRRQMHVEIVGCFGSLRAVYIESTSRYHLHHPVLVCQALCTMRKNALTAHGAVVISIVCVAARFPADRQNHC